MSRTASKERTPLRALRDHRNLLLGSILAFTALLSGCSKSASEPAPLVAVQVAPVKQSSISQVISTDAVLSPINQATITPKISSPVLKPFVVRGSRVRQGQLLVTLENRDLAAAAQENRGNFEQAQATYVISKNNAVPEELQKAELDTRAAKENLDAQQKLYDSRQDLFKQGALPRKDLDAAAVALVQARAQYEQAQRHLQGLQNVGHEQELKSAGAQLTAAEGKYKGAEAQFQYSEIRSPINGWVTDGPLYPGMIPQAGVPLITVMDLSQMIAKAHLPQSQAALLKKGNPATLRLAGTGDESKGKVILVSPALDPNSTTVEVWVQAANPKQTLKAGASATLSVVASSVANALVVPPAAVLTDEEGKKSVMVVGADSVAHKREVETGIQTPDAVQIVSGLKAGEQVVSTGAYGLPENTKVKPESPPPADEPKSADKGGDTADTKGDGKSD